MVRFYILPNADHLQEEEMNFEITLRNVQVEVDAKVEDRRRALRHAYKTQRMEPKLYSTGLEIVDEVKSLDKTIKALKQALRKEFDYTIISRLRYYLIRLSSSTANTDEEEQLKDEYCKEIEDFLRAHRQRVTYNPEQPNDETDLDFGDKTKVLKDSWRNPNVNATAQTNKSSRTGAYSKHSKHNDERDKESKSGNHSKKKDEIGKRDGKEENEIRTPSKETQKEHKTNKNIDSQNRDKKHSRDNYKKQDYKSSSYCSSSKSSDTSEDSQSDTMRKRSKNKRHDRSRGRSFSSSMSESSSEQEGSRRRNSHRYTNRSQSPPRRNRNHRDDYYRTSRSRVENWDIIFTGDNRSMQVEDFLNRVKKLAKHEKVGRGELLDKIHYKLKGEASDWWFTRESHCTTWEKFESEIRFRFGNPNRDRGIRSQLRELRQKRGETFVAFVTEVEKLNQCLKRPHSSRTIFEIVWENMRPHYRSKLATKRVRNLDHLLDLNHRIDANDPSLYRTGHSMRNEVHNIEAQSNSDSEYSSTEECTINALQRKLKISTGTLKPTTGAKPAISTTADSTGLKCWNCQKTGHHWRSCKETKLIFCYACGNVGRTTRTCERNHPQFTPNPQQQNSLN